MQQVLTKYTASISELKKSPTQLLKDAGEKAVAILNHNVPTAYLVPASMYERLMDMLDDRLLAIEVENALDSKDKPIKVDIDEL